MSRRVTCVGGVCQLWGDLPTDRKTTYPAKGIDAVGQSGGIVEAAVCYTGNVTDPSRGLYDLEYYLGFVRELESAGIHVLAIKDIVS